MWRVVGDPRWKAVLEAWSAAGNDPELALDLAPANARFVKLVSPAGAPAGGPLRDEDAKAFVLMAREAMFGLALGRANKRRQAPRPRTHRSGPVAGRSRRSRRPHGTDR